MGKIYTKTGDRGMTGSLRGRISKTGQLAETLGALDEANCWIGECRRGIKNSNLKKIDAELEKMQDNLMTISAILAGSRLGFSAREVTGLEKMIDETEKKLPKPRGFIFPEGQLQLARAVVRRAEREVIRLMENKEVKVETPTQKNILKYMNRVSDALFVLVRTVSSEYNLEERVWKRRQ